MTDRTTRSPRRRRLLLAAVIVLVVAAWAPSSAQAAELADAGWWWRLQPDGPAPLPAPPNVPPGGLMVQGAPDGASAVAAVRFTVPPEDTNPILTLSVAQGGNQGADRGVVLACPAASAWTGGDAQAWSTRPQVQCDSPVVGQLSADATTITFALGPVPATGAVDVVLTPGTSDGQPFSGTNGSTFSLVLAPPSASSLTTSSGTSATESGFGTSSFDSGSTGSFSPGPAFPSVGQPTALPALPTPAAPAAPPAAPTEPAAPTAPAQPASLVGDPITFGELLPLLLTLAVGPAMVLLARRPRFARVLARFGIVPLGLSDDSPPILPPSDDPDAPLL